MVRIIGITLAYFITGLLSLQLAIPPGYAAPVWPAAGIGLAVILLYGNRIWPGVFLGSFFVNVFTSFDPSSVHTILGSLFVPICIGGGAVFQALFGAFLIRRFAGFPTSLNNLSNVFRIMALGGPVGCLVNSSVGVTSLVLAGTLPLDNVIQNWWNWYLGDFIGVIIVIPLVVVWTLELRDVQTRTKLAVAIPVCLAFLLTIFIYFSVLAQEKKRVELLFGRQTDHLIQALQADFNATIEILYSIKGLFDASKEVDREEFHQFVAHLLRRAPGIQALEWVPRVSADQLHSYEKQAREDGYPDFQIREEDEQGLMRAVLKRDEYFPAYYLQPFSGNEKAFGFDLASNNTRLEELNRARDSGKPVASSRIVLVQETMRQHGVLFFLPIYNKGLAHETVKDRRQALLGFTLCVLRVSETVNAALQPYDLSGISFQFFDLSSEDSPQRMYAFDGSTGIVEDVQNDGEVEVNAYHIRRDVSFEMAGRQWRLSFNPTAGFFEKHKHWGPMVVLLGGFLFSSLMGVFLLLVTGRNAMTEQLVDERTKELKFSEAKQRAIVNNAVDGIITIDENVIVQSFNPAAERIFGYSAEEVIGKNVNMLQPEPYHSHHDQYVRNYLQTGVKKIIGMGREVVGRRKDGTTFPLNLSVSEVRINDKLLFTGIIRDITATKAAESALIEAKDAAEAATLAKSYFLANMSHEIRTPMNAILGMLYLAMKTEMSSTLHNYLIKTQAAANSLLHIINDILDLSKIEAGKLEIESIEFSLDSVLEQLTDAIVLQAEKKGLEFLIRYDANIPPRLIGDPLRLGQILLNLCGNAVKFTEAGEVELAFSSKYASESDLTLQITVRDSGIGMNPEVQKNLFQKFTQADQSTTRRFGGTGLGLAICRMLVELMEGHIWVESSHPGSGTIMCCTVPFKISQKDQAHHRELVEQTGPLLKDIRILVVDDNSASREILSDVLRSFQLDVSSAVSGETAIEKLKATSDKPFEVVLMDWRMPGMNGDEATRCIRADSTIQHQPKVVMVTAHGREDVIKLADQAGVNGFLIKPVAPSTLLDTILSVLGRGRLMGEDEKGWKKTPLQVAPNFAGVHLLLVEDNEINREFAVDLLHSMGIEVDEAVNGQEAVTMVQQHNYDGVLMDIQMPVIDGMEASRRIRALGQQPGSEHFATLPIIAMTAMAMAKDADKCLQAGMNDFITKPVEPDHFFVTLAKWLKLGSGIAVKNPSSDIKTEDPKTASPDIPADLLALQNFDAVLGIRRIGGKSEAYRKQLRRFRKNYSGAVDDLQRLIAEKGIVAGENYCHALKGVAGNLSASELFASITEVDALLKQGIAPEPEQFEGLRQLFQQTMDEIDGLVTPKTAQSDPPKVLKHNELLAKLLALSSLLKSDLGAADLLLTELRSSVAGTETEQAVMEIAAHVDVFAIDEALEQIMTLSRRLSGTA